MDFQTTPSLETNKLFLAMNRRTGALNTETRAKAKGNRTIADLGYGEKTLSVLAHSFLLP